MLQRLLYPWHLPPYGFQNTAAFSWQPNQLAPAMVHLPEQVKSLVDRIEYEWMFDFSCAVARQFRRVGARVDERPPSSGAVLIANDQGALSPLASAHAFIMSMAQQAAIEISGLMTEPTTPAASSQGGEITGVAFFAESAARRGSGRRLGETLRMVAEETARRCAQDDLGYSRPIQFSHSRPTQARSPINGHGPLPVAAYRIRFAGCAPETVLQALADALQALPAAHRVADRADVMVLSNLWAPIGV